MSEFRLGDRVTMTGTVKKWKHHNGPGYDAKYVTEYIDAPNPKIWNRDNGTVYTEGVIVGRRFMQEGHTDSLGYDGERVFRSSGKTHRVWIVSFDLRYKPVMCFDHQINRKDTTNGR